MYTLEPDHEEVRTLLNAASGGATYDITYVELHSALAGCRQRKAISERAYRSALQDIERDWPTIQHISVDEQLLQEAAQLAGAHALRAYDAVHLAAARAVSPLGVQFMTFALRPCRGEGRR